LLSLKSVFIRYLISGILLSLSGTGTITGAAATLCGVIGTMELATALLRYSPVVDILESIHVNIHMPWFNHESASFHKS